MKKGPYTIFAWRITFPLLGVLIALATWAAVLATNDVKEMEKAAIVVLSLTTAAFGFGGIAVFLIALRERAKLFKRIIRQDDKMAVACEDDALREMYDVKRFAQDFLYTGVLTHIGICLKKHLELKKKVPLEKVPFLFVHMQREPVLWEWMGFKRLVHGVQKGTHCVIEIQPTWQGTGKLGNHEVAHAVLTYALRVHTDMHHQIMADGGVERAEYLDGAFSEGGLQEEGVRVPRWYRKLPELPGE